jgi:hypothetical protein
MATVLRISHENAKGRKRERKDEEAEVLTIVS